MLSMSPIGTVVLIGLSLFSGGWMTDFAEAPRGMICEELDAALWIAAELDATVDLSASLI